MQALTKETWPIGENRDSLKSFSHSALIARALTFTYQNLLIEILNSFLVISSSLNMASRFAVCVPCCVRAAMTTIMCRVPCSDKLTEFAKQETDP